MALAARALGHRRQVGVVHRGEHGRHRHSFHDHCGRRTSGNSTTHANAARQNASTGPGQPVDRTGAFTKKPPVLHSTAAASTSSRALARLGAIAGWLGGAAMARRVDLPHVAHGHCSGSPRILSSSGRSPYNRPSTDPMSPVSCPHEHEDVSTASIIGGGHNGLVAAAYLAKAGKSVCVLERRHVLGGCSVTEELWPGFKVSVASYVISLFRPEIIRDAASSSNTAWRSCRANPSSFTPLLDGRSLLMGPDERMTCREIAKFSQQRCRALSGLQPPAGARGRRPGADPGQGRARSAAAAGRVAKDRHGQAAARHGPAGGDLSGDRPARRRPARRDRAARSARPGRFWSGGFEAEVLRATLATDAVIGAFASPSYPGTAYVLLHHVMGEAGGARGVWGYVQGGMGGLAAGLGGGLPRSGRRNPPRVARQAHPRRERARASASRSGTTRSSKRRVVASSIDAHQTFERLLDPAELPAEFRQAVAKIDYASASAKINLALSEPPKFTCLPASGIGPHHRGTIHIGPTLDTWSGPSTTPSTAGRAPSRSWKSRSPRASIATLARPGQHVMNIFVQYAPYKLADGKQLGRHQGGLCRPLHRALGPLRCRMCPARSCTGRSSRRSTWSGCWA